MARANSRLLLRERPTRAPDAAKEPMHVRAESKPLKLLAGKCQSNSNTYADFPGDDEMQAIERSRRIGHASSPELTNLALFEVLDHGLLGFWLEAQESRIFA